MSDKKFGDTKGIYQKVSINDESYLKYTFVAAIKGGTSNSRVVKIFSVPDIQSTSATYRAGNTLFTSLMTDSPSTKTHNSVTYQTFSTLKTRPNADKFTKYEPFDNGKTGSKLYTSAVSNNTSAYVSALFKADLSNADANTYLLAYMTNGSNTTNLLSTTAIPINDTNIAQLGDDMNVLKLGTTYANINGSAPATLGAPEFVLAKLSNNTWTTASDFKLHDVAICCSMQ